MIKHAASTVLLPLIIQMFYKVSVGFPVTSDKQNGNQKS